MIFFLLYKFLFHKNKLFFYLYFIFPFIKGNLNRYIIYNGEKGDIKLFLLSKIGFKKDDFYKSIFFTNKIRGVVSSESNEIYLKKILDDTSSKDKFILIETKKSDEENVYTVINSQFIGEENFFIIKEKIEEFLLKNNLDMTFIEELNINKNIENIKNNILFLSSNKGDFKFFDISFKEINYKNLKNENFFLKFSKELNQKNFFLIFSYDLNYESKKDEDINIIGQVFWKKNYTKNKNEVTIFSINDSYIGYGFGSILMDFVKKFLGNFLLTPVIGSFEFYKKTGMVLEEDERGEEYFYYDK